MQIAMDFVFVFCSSVVVFNSLNDSDIVNELVFKILLQKANDQKQPDAPMKNQIQKLISSEHIVAIIAIIIHWIFSLDDLCSVELIT